MIFACCFYVLCFMFGVYTKTGIKEYTLKYLIQENELIGRMVGTIATDVEGAGFIYTIHNSLTFKLSGPNCCFQIDKKTSVLTIASNIDLETICSNREVYSDCSTGQGNLELIVNLWSNIQLVAVVRVHISILDVNDNIPQFTKDKIERHVSEASHKKGHSIFLETAIDNDIAPENTRIEYGLSEHSSIFQLQVDQLRQPFLMLLQDLDAERQIHHQLKIRAWNVQDHKLRSELLVDIFVLDFNDNSPKFNVSTFSVIVRENTQANTPIFQLVAVDPDSTSRLQFGLYQATGDGLKKLFSVLENGTVVLISNSLDYERQQRYQIPVKVTDGLYDARAVLEVLVEDENDENPKLIQNPSVIEVEENGGKGLLIGQVIISDKDSFDTNGKIICLHKAASVGLAFIQSSARNLKNLVYDIRTEISFDREKSSHVLVVLLCSDGWNSSSTRHLSSSFTITINILDVNDNAPLFQRSLYTSHVSEDIKVGSKVIQVKALDLDIGVNGKIIYSLTKDSSLFQIDSSSGIIKVQGTLDRELKDKYQLTVYAVDSGLKPLSCTSSVLIIIDDINDNTPVLISPFEFTLFENNGPSIIGVLRHQDLDIGINAEVIYTKLWPPEDLITISENGTLYTTASLDREAKDRHCLRMRLRDNASSGRRQSSGEVCVKVLDVNDNKPRLTNPKGLFEIDDATTPMVSLFVILSIYESPGYIITQLVAVDDDESINAKLSYAVQLPDILPENLFSLNKSSGLITLANILTPKYLGQYRIKVRATDSGSPPLSDEKVFLLHITNKGSQEKEKMKMENFWMDRSSLLVVIILSSISLSFIVMLVTAIVCMLKPCYQRNDSRYEKDWINKIAPGRPGSLKTIMAQENLSGSLQENLLVNGNSEMSSNFLNTYVESNIDMKPYLNINSQIYTENDYLRYIPHSTLPKCHGPCMLNSKNSLSRLDYGTCSRCPVMTSCGNQAYVSFGHYIDPNNDEELKEDFQSDSGRGASEDDVTRSNVIRLKLSEPTSTFKACSIEREKSNIPMATLMGRMGSSGNINCQSNSSNNYMKPDVICDEINQLFFHNLIKS